MCVKTTKGVGGKGRRKVGEKRGANFYSCQENFDTPTHTYTGGREVGE